MVYIGWIPILPNASLRIYKFPAVFVWFGRYFLVNSHGTNVWFGQWKLWFQRCKWRDLMGFDVGVSPTNDVLHISATKSGLQEWEARFLISGVTKSDLDWDISDQIHEVTQFLQGIRSNHQASGLTILTQREKDKFGDQNMWTSRFLWCEKKELCQGNDVKVLNVWRWMLKCVNYSLLLMDSSSDQVSSMRASSQCPNHVSTHCQIMVFPQQSESDPLGDQLFLWHPQCWIEWETSWQNWRFRRFSSHIKGWITSMGSWQTTI